MSQIEPTSDSDNALANLGLSPEQSLSLPNLNGLFSLDAIEAAVSAAGWTPEEHVSELIAIARGAAKPVERMSAMRDLMKFIHDCIEINRPKVVMTRKEEYVNAEGTRVTESVEFTSRYAQGRSAAARVNPPSQFDGSDDGAFDAPDR